MFHPTEGGLIIPSQRHTLPRLKPLVITPDCSYTEITSSSSCDLLLSALQRIQQASETLESYHTKNAFKQATLDSKENTGGELLKRKRDPAELSLIDKRPKVRQQTLLTFIKKV